jgi:hypothetical protein
MFSWRFVCAITLQDLILTAIFFDKTWVSHFIYSIIHIIGRINFLFQTL